MCNQPYQFVYLCDEDKNIYIYILKNRIDELIQEYLEWLCFLFLYLSSSFHASFYYYLVFLDALDQIMCYKYTHFGFSHAWKDNNHNNKNQKSYSDNHTRKSILVMSKLIFKICSLTSKGFISINDLWLSTRLFKMFFMINLFYIINLIKQFVSWLHILSHSDISKKNKNKKPSLK
ncbi:hypothetical protein BY996DRAFT_867847 [Phakopsora pachyrhizi]|nr:hypothetical protein BY996DRAFT_867847 [Phakopsora pachyrhizi]